jgi:hypothetical protein
LCLANASRAKVKNNPAWKSCRDDPNEGITGCVYDHNNHTEPIIRLEFEFNGTKAYEKFQTVILPALKCLNLPHFTKFADYQPTFSELKKYGEIPDVSFYTEEYWKEQIATYPEITEEIPVQEIYNRVYLREIREEISGSVWNYSGLSAEQAAKRYADY